jgi:hypothetical protein
LDAETADKSLAVLVRTNVSLNEFVPNYLLFVRLFNCFQYVKVPLRFESSFDSSQTTNTVWFRTHFAQQ